MLYLKQQLNVIYDKLANKVVEWAISEGARSSGPKLLPNKSVALILDGIKLTMDVGLHKTTQRGTGNKQGQVRMVTWAVPFSGMALPWGGAEVEARHVSDLAVKTAHIGIFATRRNMARVQDMLDNKCPNWLQPPETNDRCPDAGRTLLFKESFALIVDWMHQHNRMNAKLAYWLKKYLSTAERDLSQVW
jgi:hypothetical protein